MTITADTQLPHTPPQPARADEAPRTDASGYRPHRRFDRSARLLGEPAMERLSRARVLVCGVGGVGSFTAESLARTAVGTLVLADFDLVCVTNTNRQLHALRGNIGKPKVEVMAERLKLVNPTGVIEPWVEFYSESTADSLLEPRPDYVVDAIDNITAKAHLIDTCRRRGIPVVSSMGAAARLDPTRVIVDDLARTHRDPFAAAVRDLLRKKYGWRIDPAHPTGVPAVFTDEPPTAPTDLAYDADTNGFHCVCPQSDNGMHTCEKRARIDGSVSWVTGTFGLVAASVVVRELSGQSVMDRTGVRDPWEPVK